MFELFDIVLSVGVLFLVASTTYKGRTVQNQRLLTQEPERGLVVAGVGKIAENGFLLKLKPGYHFTVTRGSEWVNIDKSETGSRVCTYNPTCGTWQLIIGERWDKTPEGTIKVFVNRVDMVDRMIHAGVEVPFFKQPY